MADKVLCEKSDLVNVADAVRSKLGVTNTYYVSELSSAIQNIQTGGGGGSVETCTVTFSSNVPEGSAIYAYTKIVITVFENNEITTKTVSYVNNTTVSNVVLNSTGMVICDSIPKSISKTNATALNSLHMYMGFTFTGNASITARFSGEGGGGVGA